MEQIKAALSIYPAGDGAQQGGQNPWMLLAKRFINDNINAINYNANFGEHPQIVLRRLHKMAFHALVSVRSIGDPVTSFGSSAEAGQVLAENWT